MITQVLFVLVVLAAVGIIGLVLVQQSKGDAGSAFGGGGSQSMFGSRGSANFLSRATSILVTTFFLGSLALAYSYTKSNDVDRSVTEESVVSESSEAPSDIPTLPDSAQTVVEGSDVPTVEAPSVDTPAVETSVVETLEADTPDAAALEVDASATTVEAPAAEATKTETPAVEEPVVEKE